MNFYSSERIQHDLELMLEPGHWPYDSDLVASPIPNAKFICLKRWTDQKMEFGDLFYRDGLYYFFHSDGKEEDELQGGAEVPELLSKKGWVAD